MSRTIPTIDEPTAPLDGTGLFYQRPDAPLAAFGGNDAAALGRFGGTAFRGLDYYGHFRAALVLGAISQGVMMRA